MEILADDSQCALPVYVWDEIKLKDKFERTSMEIFHQNELKLVELQEELNSSKSYTRNKQLIVKVYTIFEETSYIFQRLGLIELFDQLRMILSTISKLTLSFQQKPTITNKPSENENTNKPELSIVKTNTCKQEAKIEVTEKSRKNKSHRFGGIFLYNQSYYKYVQKNVGKNKLINTKFNLKDLQDPMDQNDELHRQEMNYYIERKKQLTVLKIKDHSKNYEQIQNQFRIVEQRLKQMVQNLEIQFDHDTLKQYEFLSKEQINRQFLSFNSNMRTQLVVLKDQYDNAAEILRTQNFEMRTHINEELTRKLSMVNCEVQTIETVASIKKIKKLAEEYQKKLKISEIKIVQLLQKDKDLKQTFDHISIEKQKEMAKLRQMLFTKEEQIKKLNVKCQNYQDSLQKQQNEISRIKIMFINCQQQQNEQSQCSSEMKSSTGAEQQLKVQEGSDRRNSSRQSLFKRVHKQSVRSFSRHSRYSNLENRLRLDQDDVDLMKDIKQQSCIDKNLGTESRSIKRNFLSKLSKVQINGKQIEGQPLSVPRSSFCKNREASSLNNDTQYKIELLKSPQFTIKEETDSQIKGQHLQMQIEKGNKFIKKDKYHNAASLGDRESNRINNTAGKRTYKQQNKSRKKLNETELNIAQTFKGQMRQYPSSRLLKAAKQSNGRKSLFLVNQNVIGELKKRSSSNLSQIKGLLSEQQQKNKSKRKNGSLIQYDKIEETLKNQSKDSLTLKKGKLNKQNRKKQQKRSKILGKDQKLNDGEQGQETIHLTPHQKIAIAQKLFNITSQIQTNSKARRTSEQVFAQIIDQFPQIAVIVGSSSTAHRKILDDIRKLHQGKCKNRACQHLQLFIAFCNKYRDKQGSGREAMKLPIQNFSNI